MRALRDFNIPKIVTDDLPVFMGLIGDLFPALDVPRKRDLNFEKVILAFPPPHTHTSIHPEKPGLGYQDPGAVNCFLLPSQSWVSEL